MKLHTIPKRILRSTNIKQDFFSFFQSLKLYGGLNVILKI